MSLSDEFKKLGKKTVEPEKKRSSFSDIMERQRRRKDPEEKVFQKYIPEAERKRIEVESTSTFEDIVDVVDNVNRVFYGVMASAKETITSFRDEDESLGKTAKDVGKAFSRGFAREEKVFSRDLARHISPGFVDFIEDNTTVSLWGIEVDAATPAFFVDDILLDPVTYIPFGAPLKIVSKGFKGLGKAGKAVASKIIGKKAVEGAIESVSKAYLAKVAPYTNIRSIWKSHGKELGETFDVAAQAESVAGSRSARMGIEASTTGKRNLLLMKTRKLMSEDSAKKLGEWQHGLNDDAVLMYGERYAKELGTNVDDYTKIKDMESLLEDVGLAAKGTKEEQVLLSKLGSKIKEVKGDSAKAITKRLLENKGFKKFSNKISLVERDASIEFAKSRLKLSGKFYGESRRMLSNEIKTIQKTLKSDLKITSGMLEEDITKALGTVKTLGDDVKRFVASDGAPEISKNIKASIGVMRSKLQNLTKYQLDVTKGIQKFRKSDVPLRKVNTLIRNLELDVGAEMRGVVKKKGAKLQKQVDSTMKTISKELREFQRVRGLEFRNIKGAVKVSKKLQGEIVDGYKKQLGFLLKDQAELDKFYRAEIIAKHVGVRKALKHSEKAKKEYYRAFSKFNSGKLGQKAMLEFKRDADNLFERKLRSDLPKELWEPARFIRKTYDDYKIELSRGENPILKGENPLYAPRKFKKTFLNKILNTLPTQRGGKGMLKKRKFTTYAESKKYAQAHGVEIENDAVVMLMDYSKNTEMALAKHSVDQQLVAKFGKNVPADLAKSMDYLFKDGKSVQINPFMDKVLRGYGSALNVVKASLTIINPAFHGRNFLGFPFLAATTAGIRQGFNPRNFSDALRLKLGHEGFVKAAGKKVSFEEIRKAAEASGYWGAAFTRGDISTSAKITLNRHSWKNPMRWGGEMFKLSMHSEDIGRYGSLIANIRAGKPMQEAMDAAKKAMFDYNLINSPTDKMFQGVFGFYTFCVTDDAEILTKNGWKTCDEVKVGDKVLGYNHQEDRFIDDEIKELNIFPYDGILMNLKQSERRNLHFSFTPNHTWPIIGEREEIRSTVKGYQLRSNHRIPLVAKEYSYKQSSELSQDDAALLGWILTDGTYSFVGNSLDCAIYQSPKKFVDDIRRIAPGSGETIHPDSGVIRFRLKVERTKTIKPYLRNPETIIPMLFNLNEETMKVMWEAMYKADGTTSHSPNHPYQEFLACQKPLVGDVFQVLSLLLGKATHKSSKGLYVKKGRFLKANGILGTEWYKGRVWCPTTNCGYWMMRRNGKIIITGNTRRNLPQQVITMLNDPKQFAVVSKALHKISNREKITDEELGYLSQYEKETFKIFGDVVDGVREFTTLGFLPVEEAYQTINSIRSGEIHEIFGGRVNPLVGSFLDWYYGKDSFYRTDFGNNLPARYTNIIPESLQKVLGLSKQTKNKYRGGEIVGTEEVLVGDVDTIFSIRKFPVTSRFINDLTNVVDAVKSGKPGRGILRYTTNIRVKDLDVEKRKRSFSFKERKALRKKAKSRGAKTFERTYIPKDPKKRLFSGSRKRLSDRFFESGP